MIQAVIEGVLGLIVECLIGLFWWFLLFPVIWLVSLPVILIVAPFRRERFSVAVASMLMAVHCAWRDWGFFITP